MVHARGGAGEGRGGAGLSRAADQSAAEGAGRRAVRGTAGAAEPASRRKQGGAGRPAPRGVKAEAGRGVERRGRQAPKSWRQGGSHGRSFFFVFGSFFSLFDGGRRKGNAGRNTEAGLGLSTVFLGSRDLKVNVKSNLSHL